MATAALMVMWTTLQVAQVPDAAAPVPTLFEVDCALPAGRVLSTGGRLVTECPGFQRVSVAGAQDLVVMVVFGRQVGVEKTVPVPLEQVTHVRVEQQGGSPRIEVTVQALPAEALAAAPWDTLPVEENPVLQPSTAPPVPMASVWKSRTSGLLLLLGCGMFAMGLSAAATAGTRMLVGSEPVAGAFPMTGLWGVFNSITLLTSPGLLVVGLGTCVLGIGAMAAGFFWSRGSLP